jgi:ABC-type Mn2+/Zn2+ transport system ATPase subunit
MERLGIAPLADRQIGELSGGQQQRVLLARALAQQADLLLLDEPFAAMDAHTTEVVFDVLEELRMEGKTLLVATHYLDRLEEKFDGALYLANGWLAEPEPGAFVGEDFRKAVS